MILTAHSKVFKAMFTQNTQEAAIRVVKIEDIDAETIKAFIENMSNIAFKLFNAADKYMIDDLKVSKLELELICNAF
jgi:hypothetical protein